MRAYIIRRLLLMIPTVPRYRVVPDMDEKFALLKQANAYVIEQLPYIILPGPSIFRYAWPWVMNYEGEVMSGYMTSVGMYSISWIDQVMKADMGF